MRDLRLTPETRKPFGIGSECGRKKFDRDAAAQLRIGGLIHLSHSARSQVAGDFVVCEFGSDHDVTKVAERILSEPLQITQGFEDGAPMEHPG